MIRDEFDDKTTCTVCDEKFIVETESGVSAGFCPVCGSELDVLEEIEEDFFYLEDEEYLTDDED